MNRDTLDVREPFRYVTDKILEAILSGVQIEEPQHIKVEEPPKPELGDLAIPLFRLAKAKKVGLEDLYREFKPILESIEEVESVKLMGGYIDIWLRPSKLSRIVFESLRSSGEEYGIVKVMAPKRYVVEYVSANPVHPLHIGSGRNAALGKALESMLRLRGHIVESRFYINDLGRQVAIMVLGYRLLGGPQPPAGVKEDHWIGYIYAATNVIIEILKLKKEIEKSRGDPDRYRELVSRLDDLMSDAARLRERYPEYFDRLSSELSGIEDIESVISELMIGYEKKSNPETVELFRKAVDLCIEGFKKTLSQLEIEFDKWDYESEIAWSGDVEQILSMAMKSPYIVYKQGVPALSFSEILKSREVRERLKLPKTLEIPPLVLMRSDMTTLYTVRDIAYSIKKFREFNADYVINVIAAEQRLAQAQLRLALYMLGFRKEAENLIHYSYEMVNLPGIKMSGRRGRYVTLDEVLESAVERVRDIVRRRSPNEGVDEGVVRHIAVSAVKYALASIDPNKQLVFKLEEALDLERNSAPYLLYTYARANSLLEKAGPLPSLDEVDYSAADNHAKRRELLLMISKSPTVFSEAIDRLSPEDIASHILVLADLFNSWYQVDPVIREQDPGVKGFKQYLVYGVRSVIGNGLRALGIRPLSRI